MLLPSAATEILVFESTGSSLANPNSQIPAAAIIIPESKTLNAGDSYYSFASVSDVHVNYTDYGAAQKWTNALNLFAQKKLDSVIISGDMTGSGSMSEYQSYIAAIEASNFPADKIFEARGNHDSQNNAMFLRFTSSDLEKRPNSTSPYFYVLVESPDGHKDNLFIFLAQELSNASNTNLQDNFSDNQMNWLESLLEQYAGTDTNIFIVEHAVIRNFGPGDRYNGVYVQPLIFSNQYKNNMRLKSLLTEYKEVIMMTGHTHLSFYDWLNYSDENGTAARMIHNSSISQPRSYTSSGSISYNSEGKTTSTYGSEGYMVYVYDDYILYVGYNLSTGKIIPRASFILESYVENRSDVTNIELKSSPTKTKYLVGEFFDPTGIEIEAVYSDGTRATVNGWGIDKLGELSAEDKEIIVSYGELSKTISVKIKVGDYLLFEGDGTKDSPYLISTSDDFLKLTQLFNQSTESQPFGKDMFFLQTADIDMTGVAGYDGTNAQSGIKHTFSGVYDGGGHKLTVAITASSGQRSVFPYLCGVICNLTMRGSISAPESAQPIRTTQTSGVIANCDISLTLTSSIENGLCYSNHGTIFRNYVHSDSKVAVCTTNDGKTYNVISDPAKLEQFLNESSSDTNSGLAAIRQIDPAFTLDDLLPFEISNGELVFKSKA